MAGEKARQLTQAAADVTASAISELQESHGLRHLYGQPLDLSDDSPDWFIHKLLKREGIAPPLVEQGRDLDAAEQAARAIVTRLRHRGEWLRRPESRCTPAAARAFNQASGHGLDAYRAALVDLNRLIRDFNLTAPAPLHRRGIIVDAAVAEAARAIPALDEVAATPATARRSFWRRLRGSH